MSNLVNNGEFRNRILTVQKRVNNVVTETFVFNILNAFGSFSAITETQFATMNNSNYTTRMNAFLTYVEGIVADFNRNMISNQPNGTDTSSCPLPGEDPVTVIVTNWGGGMEPLMGGTLDDHLTWGLTLSGPAPRDIPYSFDVLLKDRNGNAMRTESCYGTVEAGKTFHNSADDNVGIYVPEVYDSMLGPNIIVERITASLVVDL